MSPEDFENCEHCLLCGSQHHETAFDGVEDWFFRNVKGSFTFERCTDCGSLWLSRRLTAAALPQAYATYYTHNPVAPPCAPPLAPVGLKAWLRERYVRQRFKGGAGIGGVLASTYYRAFPAGRLHLDAPFRFAPRTPSRILDYGCGGGEYLRLMRELGHDVVGVDADAITLAPLKEDGFEVYSVEEFESRDWYEAFACITLSHVLEHLPAPFETLASLLPMLKPDGMLYIEVPNADAAGLDVFGRYWRGLEAPRHLAIPSKRGLADMLTRANVADLQWVVRGWTREWTWPASLQAVPLEDRAQYQVKMEDAAVSEADAAEYLIVAGRKKV